MGAEQFWIFETGATAMSAFHKAVEKANFDHGNSGYTGTIAEKSEFVMIADAATREHARAMSEKLLEDRDDRIDDKWGPAGCIRIPHHSRTMATAKYGEDEFMFFGWASS